MRIQRWSRYVCAFSLLAIGISTSAAALLGQAFTYQGQLRQNGVPANGTFTMDFRLFDAATTPPGVQIGQVIQLPVPVTNGLFTVELNGSGQFGANALDGSERWLDIRVNGAALTPRQHLTATPYARTAAQALSVSGIDGYSLNASDGSPTDALLVDAVGNVGLGISTPDNRLHVFKGSAGNVTADPSSAVVVENSANAYLTLLTPDASERGLLFGEASNAVAGGIIYNAPATPDGFQFRTNGNVVRAVMSSAGNLGLGTTSPTVPIDVVGSSQTMLSLSSPHAGGTWLNVSNTSTGGKGWNLITTGSGNGEGAGHLLFRNGTDSSVVLTLAYDGKTYLRNELTVDQSNANAGTITGGLRFGYASGEGIASRRTTGGNQYGLDFYTGATARLSIANNGNVGIGTTSPAAPLDMAVGDKRFQVRSDGGLVPGINLTGTGGNMGILRIRNAIEMWPDDGGTRPGKIALVNAAATAFTVSFDGGNGDANLAGNLSFGSTTRQMLDLWGGVYGIGVQGYTEYFRSDGGFAWFNGGSHDDATNNPGAGGSVLMVLDSRGYLGIGTENPVAKLDVNGRTRTDSLEIVGGADLAEPIEVDGDEVRPGLVVAIDPDRPGRFKVSSQPYDRRVAGIVSGANGLASGMVMRAAGDRLADGERLLALAGRVWCYCDASCGAITPGDLLTTSATPGHAMRVADDHEAPRGCIIGKAMTALPEGKGLVLVLVNLQ